MEVINGASENFIDFYKIPFWTRLAYTRLNYSIVFTMLFEKSVDEMGVRLVICKLHFG